MRDISHDETAEQAEDVHAIMGDLGVSQEVPQIEIWNKIDLLAPEEQEARLTEAARRDEVVALSALTGEGIDRLYAAVDTALAQDTFHEGLSLTFAQGRNRAWLHEAGVVEAERQTETGWDLELRWSRKQAAQYAKDVAG